MSVKENAIMATGDEDAEVLYGEPNLNGIGNVGGPKGGKIFGRLSDIMSDIQAVGKNSKNKDQGYNFRSIDEVYNMVQPLLAKHRVFSLPKVLSESLEERKTKNGGALITRLMTVRFRFHTDDGSYVDVTTRGEGMDTGDKASNKAMTAAHKYAIIMLFAIPTRDSNDGDHESPENKDGGIATEEKRTPMLKDSPENYEKVQKLIKEMPGKHRYKTVELDKLSLNRGRILFTFLRLFISINKGLIQMAGRDDVPPAEIKSLRDALFKAETKADLEAIIEAIPAPSKKEDSSNKTPLDEEIEKEELPFK